MKILVIFTGGTIGSTVGENFISLDESKKYALIDHFYKNSDLQVEFDVENPYSIFSENLSGKELTTLCKLVESKVNSGYDGIIVTHGTDTIQYTASALAYTVKTQIPIILVSSNFPLDNKLSNGHDNFLGAVQFINQNKKGGVFVAYKNFMDNAVEFFHATRLLSHNEASDALSSIDGYPYGFYVLPCDNDPSIIDFEDKITILDGVKELSGRGAIGAVDFVENPNVLFINSHPADSFKYNVEDYSAILIKPYHSGTLDTDNKNFIEFCKKAKAKNVPVFIPNIKGDISYDTTKIFDELGVTVLIFATSPATYVKIWLAVSLNKDIKDFVLNEINGEFFK